MLAGALAQHANGLHLGIEGNAGDAQSVVGLGGDGAGHMGAMPAGVGGRAAHAAFARGGPVAGVAGIGVAAVAIVGDGGLGDHVVAGHGLAGQVGMGPDAGVDDGYDHARAGGTVPGSGGADAAGGLEQIPLRGVAAVIGGEQRVHHAVGLGIFDIDIGRLELGRELAQLLQAEGAVELEDMGAGAHLPQHAELGPQGRGQALGTGGTAFKAIGGHATGLQGHAAAGLLHQGAAVAVLDDEAVAALGVRGFCGFVDVLGRDAGQGGAEGNHAQRQEGAGGFQTQHAEVSR